MAQKKPKFGNKEQVKGGALKRTRRRLATLRADDTDALKGVGPRGGFTGREARQVKSAYKKYKARSKRNQQGKGGSNQAPFNPLAPLTGKAFDQETDAASQLKFGESERDLRQRLANQAQTTVNTAGYYDEYKKALADATTRVNDANAANVQESQARVDTAHAQDSQRVQAADAQASSEAARLGRGQVASTEGAQAVEAGRTQGNMKVAELRKQAGADTKLMELRGATSVQAKAEAVQRQNARHKQLEKEGRDIASDKGAFRLERRDQARQSEREWAAIQKEFKLERRDQNLEHKQSAADRKLERYKVNGQKLIARLYSDASKAKARATIRVAKLQLEKGKIDQSTYVHILNEYKGLPDKPGGGGGQWGGKLDTPVEKQKADQMFADLVKRKPSSSKRNKIINGAVANGVPRSAARAAWDRYAKKFLSPGGQPGANYGGPRTD